MRIFIPIRQLQLDIFSLSVIREAINFTVELINVLNRQVVITRYFVYIYNAEFYYICPPADIGKDFILMDDNAIPHRVLLVKYFRECHGLERMG